MRGGWWLLLLGTVLAAGVVARLSQRDPPPVQSSGVSPPPRTVRSCANLSAVGMTVRGIRPQGRAGGCNDTPSETLGPNAQAHSGTCSVWPSRFADHRRHSNP